MAAPTHLTTVYTSSELVESAGTILFDLSSRQICLVHDRRRDRWLLPKGRRNCGESRQEAALRETREETGYRCNLLEVTLSTRAPPTVESGFTPDEPRTYTGDLEPFMVMMRQLPGERNVKIIWWYVATINGKVEESEVHDSGEMLNPVLFSFEEALQKLTYQVDREVAHKAMEIVKATYGEGPII